jgi:DNA-binding response OmpR family regulator
VGTRATAGKTSERWGRMTVSLTQVDDGVVELRIVVRARADPDQLSRVAARLVEVFDGQVVRLPEAAEPVRIEVGARRVFERDAEVELSRLEFDLLLFLSRNAGRAYDRAALMLHVWRSAVPRSGRTVDVHIRKLRRKIELIAPVITTVRGVGYRFDGGHLVRIVEGSPERASGM